MNVIQKGYEHFQNVKAKNENYNQKKTNQKKNKNEIQKTNKC